LTRGWQIFAKILILYRTRDCLYSLVKMYSMWGRSDGWGELCFCVFFFFRFFFLFFLSWEVEGFCLCFWFFFFLGGLVWGVGWVGGVGAGGGGSQFFFSFVFFLFWFTMWHNSPVIYLYFWVWWFLWPVLLDHLYFRICGSHYCDSDRHAVSI